MSEDLDIFENRWRDKIELHKYLIKIKINDETKYSMLGDKIPTHPTGTFTFRYEQLEFKELTFIETSYGFISGRIFGYIGIRNVLFPFDSNNSKWQGVVNLTRDKLEWSNTYNANSAEEEEKAEDYDAAIEIWEEIDEVSEVVRVKKLKAEQRESAKDYDAAIEMWEELGEINEAARVRKLKSEQGSVKVAQSVVQGDQITKTEIKDSVLNRSNVGGGSSKMQELEKLTEMKKEGLIDDDEFKQMKKEILGK